MSLSSNHPGPPNQSANAADVHVRQHWRFTVLFGALILVGGIIVVRLFQYQLVDWLHFDMQKTFPITDAVIEAPRGVIVDRDGELLAADRFRYQIIVDPSQIPTEEWANLAYWLQNATGISADDTWRILGESREFNYALLGKDLDLALGKALIEAKAADRAAADKAAEDAVPVANLTRSPVRYLTMKAVPSRYYPQNELGSQVVGFVNRERHGFYGLEGYYDLFLQADGVSLPKGRVTTPDSLSPQVRTLVPSTTGKDLVLTLDRTVQWIIEGELRDALSFYKAESGTIIVMDPKSGAILGLANQPSYDPNHFDQVDDFHAFQDSAISGQYEPGSIFKIITMAAAIDTETVTPTTIFTDTGSVVVGGRVILNSSRTAGGTVTVEDALARSLNVTTAQVAEKVGAKNFYKYVDLFGFGQPTEVDLFGEVDGLVKSPGDPNWSEADLGTNSFGQGLAVTPMQMINATAAIANGGTLMRPYIVQDRVEGDRVLETQPTVVRRVLSPESAATMRDMMVYTVEYGNTDAKVAGYTVAGKSGTAQIPTPEGYDPINTIASFVGFVPADDPQFVLLVKLDRPDPKITLWASHSAAPVFARVATRLLEHLNIPPDSVRLGIKP